MGSVFKRRGARRGSPWLYKVKGADGKWHTYTGLVDKEASEALCRNEQRRQDRLRVGIVDPVEEAQSLDFEGHLKQYLGLLKTKETTADQQRRVKQRIEAIAKACGFRLLSDIQAEPVAEYLHGRRQSGDLTNRTSNAYLQAFRGFCSWLVRRHRLPSNPLADLRPLRIDPDDVRQRRAGTDEDVAALLKATKEGPVVGRLTGEQRYWLYWTALSTGFRSDELASLAKASFELSGSRPAVTLAARASKRRQKDVQPILPEEAAEIASWLRAQPDGLLWPGSWHQRAADMLAADRTAAKIPEVDDRGRYFDFHALRHTFITRLVRANLPPKTVQLLARHSDIRLTMDLYTDLPVGDLYDALRAAHQKRTMPDTK